ncbi:MAG: LysM peptidoglycan-binding domain-containing protein [Candidatus Binatia bacterium]
MLRVGWSVLLIISLWTHPAWAAIEVSPSFLGMYRKTMVIEQEVFKYSAHYGVDQRTARAVLIQESGGNDKLTSSAGARGYFQVMPGTFRLLKVRSNIEAGIKYLSQMKKRFGREDYAIAAYNAGPGRIGKKRPLPLETLQYVIGVGHYKTVLRLHEPEVARQAATIQLRRVSKGDSWETLARKTGIPAPLLRFYNPFLALRPLRTGALVAYPQSPPAPVLESDGEHLYYTSRIGDSHLNLAFIFGIDPDTFRQENGLWRLQQLAPGVHLRLPLPPESPFRSLPSKTIAKPLPLQVAMRSESLETTPPAGKPSKIVKQPKIKKEAKTIKKTKKSKTKIASKSKRVKRQSRRVHNVRRGDTLGEIAQRYGTSVRSLMRANSLRTSRIQAGASLRIPNG